MFGNLFKKKKTDAEIRLEQYVERLNSVTSHYNGVKTNDTLVGKISATRMDEINCTTTEIKPVDYIEKSVPRPKVFNENNEEVKFDNNLFGWMDLIRKEAKETMNKNHQMYEEERILQERIKAEKNEKALRERREFYVSYGLLPKQTA
jgi:hypothetical protein